MSNLRKAEKAEIEKLTPPSPAEIEQKILGYDLIFKVGDSVWSSNYGTGKVVRLTGDQISQYNKDHLEETGISVQFPKGKGNTFDGGPRTYSLNELKSGYVRLLVDPENFDEDVKGLVNGTLGKEDLMRSAFPNVAESNSREVMIMSKDILLQKKREMILKRDFLTTRSEAAKELLEQRTRQLREIASEYSGILMKLNRLIYTIELYLGVNEELHHLKQGAIAQGEPICFRQRRLYMDVEVGEVGEDLGGLDFSNIEAFDEWLLRKNTYWGMFNYEIMMPEKKGIVIFKVREREKHYSDNPFVNWSINRDNNLTYVLIRNGDNIYRIYGDITIGEKLFPDQSELEGLLNGKGEQHRRVNNKEEILERYKLNMILLQGIIERTICFPEEMHSLSIFKTPIPEDKVRFIYDADKSKMLPAGIKTFKEWWTSKRINIEEGARIFVSSNDMGRGRGNWSDRFLKYYEYDGSIPSLPNTGIYLVETIKERYSLAGEKLNPLAFKYLPAGERAWSWTDKHDTDLTRKNRVSFLIYKDDSFLINYDELTREDLKLLEFYLHTRLGREDYLSNMPMLEELRKAKEAEIIEEDDFIKLSLIDSNLDPEIDFNKGLEAITWWKTKNKWKRSLKADDHKAYRMITNKLTKTVK